MHVKHWVVLAAAVCFGSGVAHAQLVSSTFDSGDEGWTLVGDPTSGTPAYSATGGNPGGYITGIDDSQGIGWYFNAPAQFLGDQSAAFGGTLSFDLRQSGGAPWSNDDVVLGGGGNTLVFDFPNDPGQTWTSFSAGLDAGAGWVHDGSGTPASSAEIQATLVALTSLQIRGEFVSGPDTGDLDNVILTAGRGAIPTMSPWGAGLLIMLIAGAAIFVIRLR